MKTKILLTSALLFISSSLASTVTIDCKPEGLKFANGTYENKWHTDGCLDLSSGSGYSYAGCYNGDGKSEHSIMVAEGSSYVVNFYIEKSIGSPPGALSSVANRKELFFNLRTGVVLMCMGGESCYEVTRGACRVKIVSD